MNVVTLDSKYWSDLESRDVGKDEIQAAAESAADEVVNLIPFLPGYVNLVVSPTIPEQVIPETGDGGMTYGDDYSSVYFDYTVPHGKKRLLSGIRTTTFHELVHAATYQYEAWQPGVLYGAVTEGLATVFERDYADSQPLWGEYEDDETMDKWLHELEALSPKSEKDMDYFVNHPDGRKWIVYKTGVWIVDKLLQSDENLFELMKLGHNDVIAKFKSL